MTRRIAAWLAILTLLLNTPWPLIMHAKPTSIPQEICTASGVKTISGAGGQDMPVPPVQHD